MTTSSQPKTRGTLFPVGIAAIAMIALLTMEASAATLNFGWFHRGWYNDTGVNNDAWWDNNYFVGETGGKEYRNWMQFDLSSLSQPIGTATLRVSTSAYSGTDPSETWFLYDVTTPVAQLGGAASTAVFADLGTGTPYGSITVSGNSVVDIVLNAAAINEINAAAGGMFVLGGRLGTLPGGIFSMSNVVNNATTQLLLDTAVPAPASVWLFGSALGLLGRVRRRSG